MSGIVQQIVVVDGTIELQQCGLYSTHKHPLIEKHHIVPESWWINAGIPVASELINLCPNCHYNVHVVIDAMIKNQVYTALPLRCQKLGVRGVAEGKALHLPISLTL